MSRRLPKKEQVALRFLGRFWIPITFTALLMAACGQPPSDQDAGETTAGETTGAETTAQEALTPGEGALVIYSGRSEELVGPLFEQYEEESGVPVVVLRVGWTECGEEGGDAVRVAHPAGSLGAGNADRTAHARAAGCVRPCDPYELVGRKKGGGYRASSGGTMRTMTISGSRGATRK
jgi:hypothetical protein